MRKLPGPASSGRAVFLLNGLPRISGHPKLEGVACVSSAKRQTIYQVAPAWKFPFV